jgi:hypothetical protein
MTTYLKPTPVPLSIDEYLDTISDERVLQVATTAVYNAASSRIAYIGLGMAAQVISAHRNLADGSTITMSEAIETVNGMEFRGQILSDMGGDYVSRALLVRNLALVKQRMEDRIRMHWPEFAGRSLMDELMRTAEPRLVRAGDVDAIYEHFDKELAREDIIRGLQQDAETEAARNRARIDIAHKLLVASNECLVEGTNRASDLTEPNLTSDDERRLLERIEPALKRFEVECLAGKARGFSNSIERLASARTSKDARAVLVRTLAHSRFHEDAGAAPGLKPEVPVNVTSNATHDARYLESMTKF